MIIGQWSSTGIDFKDEVLVLVMLSSLPDSWSATVTAVNASSVKFKLTLDEVRNLMISEEVRRKESGSTSGSALNMDERGRSKSRQNQNRGRSKSRGKSQSRQKKDKDSIQCWNCEEFVHYKNQCTVPKKNKKGQDEKKIADAATTDGGDMLVLSVSSPLESWVLDSGASFHSCGDARIMELCVRRIRTSLPC